MSKDTIKKLLVIGKKPLPIGGVTIHVQRLLEYLTINKLDYYFYDLSKFSFFSFVRSIKNYKYAHIHTSSPHLRLIFSLICVIVQTKSIITIHGNLNRFGKIKNLIDKLSIKFCTYPIVINNCSYEIAMKLNSNTQLLSAYLPPIKKDELPIEITEMLQDVKNKYKFIVVTNAYAKSYDINSDEIYGIDFLIQYFKTMNDYALIISDPSGDYIQSYSSQILNFPNIKIIGYPHSFIKVLEYADIYIRNTSTDGDSLSIHEAISLGVSVIATDVVDRPENVYLIKRNNLIEFRDVLLSIGMKKHNKIINNYNMLEIISFYKTLQ
jgi:glycosyltransferase involved in cell wall biosynthesis